ncbi:hypothetical protein, partial [Thermobacillus xylanilyticus]|uniref:hypothetical protein n=1 Tax=Thermobacillus xylanilyticus TaxID=76633 RepID=UPI001BCFB989
FFYVRFFQFLHPRRFYTNAANRAGNVRLTGSQCASNQLIKAGKPGKSPSPFTSGGQRNSPRLRRRSPASAQMENEKA